MTRRNSRSAVLAGVLVTVVAVVACGRSTARGTVTGGIVPGGVHRPMRFAGGEVTLLDASQHVVATEEVAAGKSYSFTIEPGTFTLRATYLGEPCSATVVIRARQVATVNTVCQGK